MFFVPHSLFLLLHNSKINMAQTTSNPQPCSPPKEPVALIGIGCRFPGKVKSPHDLWQLLCQGIDSITDVPKDRWNADFFHDPSATLPGKIITRRGGFLQDFDRFDAAFFGISPREAVAIDPQQRLLLEVAWEALEDAGFLPEKLRGSDTSVFVGEFALDYKLLLLSELQSELIGPHSGTGSFATLLANRISHWFDFHGASIALDTACSSSLIAIHLACESIWHGKSKVALAGGVNLIFKPEWTIAESKGGFLSPDGRCKSFDARANGYVRGEGAAIVVLKPLSQAIQDRDRIYATICGSATNQDGHTQGITVPSVQAQQALIRDVCQQAAIAPHEISYVEAHGTGTAVGDPIEAEAIGTILSQGRAQDNPCLVGSIKSNMGHLEAAAGIAGLIKASLVLYHQEVPPNLHFETPNPNIPFDALKIKIPQSCEPLSREQGPLYAAVNSFGFGGSNAHVLLREAPLNATELPDTQATEKPLLLALSAHTEEALRDTVKQHSERLNNQSSTTPQDLLNLCYTTAGRRSRQTHRAAFLANSKQELQEELHHYLEGNPSINVIQGKQGAEEKQRATFVFSGMGPQWWGMGRELIETVPLFKETILECDQLLRTWAPWSLWDELTATEDQSRLHETQFAQPANFAIQVGLARLWASWGIHPGKIVGHSVGETAAAYIAGGLSLQDALLINFHRSRLQQKTAGQGQMLAAEISESKARDLLAAFTEDISIAAINSPHAVTFAGAAAPLQKLHQQLRKQDIYCNILRVEVPYHSPVMDPLQEEFLESVHSIRPQETQVPLFSTVLGQEIKGTDLTPAYWWKNIREPVLFAPAIRKMLEQGDDLFLELGPHPALSIYIKEMISNAGRQGRVLHSLHRKHKDQETLSKALAELYCQGQAIDWDGYMPASAKLISLPTYAWQKERFWLESEASKEHRLGAGGNRSLLGKEVHPLLGARIQSSLPLWDGKIDLKILDFLKDHQIENSLIFPGAGYLEMALAAARELKGDSSFELQQIQFKRPLLLAENKASHLQLTCNSSGDAWEIHAFNKHAEEAWLLQAKGRLTTISSPPVAEKLDIEALKSSYPQAVDRDRIYETFSQLGLNYGPQFQGIEQLNLTADGALVSLRPVAENSADDNFLVHPSILDACFQTLLAIGIFAENSSTIDVPYLPVKIDRLIWHPAATTACWCEARLLTSDSEQLRGNLTLFDAQGTILAELYGITCKALSTPQENSLSGKRQHVYQYQWVRQEDEDTATPSNLPAVETLANWLQLAATRTQATEACPAGIHQDLDQWCVRSIFHTLTELGWKPGIFEIFSLDALTQKLKVPAENKYILNNLLHYLEAKGLLRKVDQLWQLEEASLQGKEIYQDLSRLQQQSQLQSVESLWQVSQNPDLWPDGLNHVLNKYPAHAIEIFALQKIFSQLKNKLKSSPGRESSFLLPDNWRLESSCRRVSHLSLLQVLLQIQDSLGIQEPLRILEVHGEQSALLPYLVPQLGDFTGTYTYASSQPEALTQAKEAFGEHAFIDFQLLSPHQNLEEQGVQEDVYDLVLFSRNMSAPAPTLAVVKNLKKLLKKDGVLLLTEQLSTPLWWQFLQGQDYAASPCLTSMDDFKTEGFNLVEIKGDATEFQKNTRFLVAKNSQKTTKKSSFPLTSSAPSSAEYWLLFKDSGTTADWLAQQFITEGKQAILISSGDAFKEIAEWQFQVRPDSLDDHLLLLQELDRRKVSVTGMIHLWSLDRGHRKNLTDQSFQSTQRHTTEHLLIWLKALDQINLQASASLFLITEQAQALHGDPSVIDPFQAPLWGLGRVLQNEHPEINCIRIDLENSESLEERELLWRHLNHPEQDDEIALRGVHSYANRLTPVSVERTLLARGIPNTQDLPQAFQLGQPPTAKASPVSITACDSPSLASSQVRVQIEAAGIPLSSMDQPLPHSSIECSGIITEVGKEVTDLKVGEQVFGFVENALASESVTHWSLMVPKPKQMGFHAAASLPLGFTTAYYILHFLNGLAPHHAILVRQAFQPSGLAMLQLAKKQGISLMATVNTAAEQSSLQAFGFSKVWLENSVDLEEEIQKATHNKGIDVILDYGSDLDQFPLQKLLSPFGRYVAIQSVTQEKEDSYTHPPLKKNQTFHSFDLISLCQQRPEWIGTTLQEISKLIESENLSPIPYQSFSLANYGQPFWTKAAFPLPIKSVVELQSPLSLRGRPAGSIRFRKDASYLITGGMSGFGLACARWMVASGARNLILLGRSGAASTEAQQTVKELAVAGATLLALKGDVTRKSQLASILGQIEEQMPPLAGIIHAANVYDDTSLLTLNAERLHQVMGPKALGAWNLHQLTRHQKLDFFVLFSSISAVVGNPDQGSYVAANCFLNALAQYRKSQNLPALSVNWGAIADVGILAQSQAVSRHLERIGIKSITSSQAFELLSDLMQMPLSQPVVADVDWLQWSKVHKAGQSARFSLVRKQNQEALGLAKEDSPQNAGTPSFLDELQEAPQDEQLELLQHFVIQTVGQVLGIQKLEQIESDQGFFEMGMDSILSGDLWTQLQSTLAVRLPRTLIFKYPTIQKLVDFLCFEALQLHGEKEEIVPQADTAPPQDKLLTDQEIQTISQLDSTALSPDEVVELEKLLGE